MKKILYLITKSDFGGAQKYVFDLATYSKKSGFDAKVACGSGGRLVSMLEERDVEVIEIKNLRRDVSILDELHSLMEIFKIIKNERPDVLHVNSSKAGGLGAFAGRILGVEKIIFTAHGLPQFERRSLLPKILIAFFTWLTMIFSTFTILVSFKDFDSARRFPFVSRKTFLIPNGIEDFKILPRSGSLDYLLRNSRKKSEKKDFIIGTISELTPNKGLIFAIRSIGELLKNQNVLFVIIGTGELESKIRNLIRSLGLGDQVHLCGFIPEAKKYLSAFDVFLLSSFKEGHPYALLEAAAAGKSICASRVGGIPDIVEDGVDGSLFEAGNANNLKNALKQALNRKAVYGERIREKYEQKFLFKKMAEKTLKLYRVKH